MFHDPCKYKGLCSHHILLDVWCLYLRSGSIQSCSITPPASSFPSHHSAWSPESLGTIQGDFKVEWRHVCFSLTVTGTAQVYPLVAICSLLFVKNVLVSFTLNDELILKVLFFKLQFKEKFERNNINLQTYYF